MRIFGMSINVHGTHKRPLFLVDDVAEWLELENVSAMLQNVDEDEIIKTILPPDQCLAGLQPNTEYEFLTEAGLFETLFLSPSPIAKEFKKGVKLLLHDVRTGKGIMACAMEDPCFSMKNMQHRYFGSHQRR
jgi:prophage antirepressor-like protein